MSVWVQIHKIAANYVKLIQDIFLAPRTIEPSTVDPLANQLSNKIAQSNITYWYRIDVIEYKERAENNRTE